MQRLTTRQIKLSSCSLLAFAVLALAGCGNHDQAGTGGNGTMTPAQIQQNTQKQNEFLKNHPPSNAQGAPAAPATQ